MSVAGAPVNAFSYSIPGDVENCATRCCSPVFASPLTWGFNERLSLPTRVGRCSCSVTAAPSSSGTRQTTSSRPCRLGPAAKCSTCRKGRAVPESPGGEPARGPLSRPKVSDLIQSKNFEMRSALLAGILARAVGGTFGCSNSKTTPPASQVGAGQAPAAGTHCGAADPGRARAMDAFQTRRSRRTCRPPGGRARAYPAASAVRIQDPDHCGHFRPSFLSVVTVTALTGFNPAGPSVTATTQSQRGEARAGPGDL